MKLRKKAARRRGITLAEMAVALALIMIVSVATTSLCLSVSEREKEISDTMAHNEHVENIIECYQWANGNESAFFEAMGELGYLGSVTVDFPSCTMDGLITCKCDKHDDYYTMVIPSVGHIYDKGVVTEPTCTGQGYTTYTCFRCESSYDDEYVDATDHAWDECVVTPPTCEKEGYTTYTCVSCGDSYVDEETKVPPTDHDWNEGVVTIEPGCETAGEKTYTCKNDSSHTKTEEIPAQHDYQPIENSSDGDVHKEKCTSCGDEQTVEHTWDTVGGKQVCACGAERSSEDQEQPDG